MEFCVDEPNWEFNKVPTYLIFFVFHQLVGIFFFSLQIKKLSKYINYIMLFQGSYHSQKKK